MHCATSRLVASTAEAGAAIFNKSTIRVATAGGGLSGHRQALAAGRGGAMRRQRAARGASREVTLRLLSNMMRRRLESRDLRV